MARNNSMVVKAIYKDGVTWTITHNKFGNREQSDNMLELIREWPNSEHTIGVEFIGEDFYNMKQCRDYINKWHKENSIKEI